MECSSGRSPNTVRRPRTSTLCETDMRWRVPVSRCIDRNTATRSLLDPLVQDRDDLITPSYSECSTGAEIILHIDNQERVALLHMPSLTKGEFGDRHRIAAKKLRIPTHSESGIRCLSQNSLRAVGVTCESIGMVIELGHSDGGGAPGADASSAF